MTLPPPLLRTQQQATQPMLSYAELLPSAQASPAGLAFLASNQRFSVPQHLALLNNRLRHLAYGDIKRLMIFMPPRHGKSWLCSQYFPAWYIGAFKGRVILASYEATFAESWGRLARNVLTEWGPSVFGVNVAQDSSAAGHWELEGANGERGVMYTAGVGGGITGKGASLLIIDDPVKNMEEAQSPTIREKAWQWYASTAFTRLEPDGRVLVIQTRWHDDDLSGRILKGGSEDVDDREPWHVLSLPAIAEHDETYPIASADDLYERAEGAALWSDRFSESQLARIRAEVGSQVWISLYQQRPTPEAGLLIHREWFKRYTTQAGPPKCERIIQTIDTAFKTGVANDYSVIATWGYTPNAIYVLDCWRSRVEYPDLKRAIADQAAKWKPQAIYVEDTAAGQSIIQELARGTLLPIIPWQPRGSKEARIAAVSPLIEAGKVYIPDDQPWVAEWLDEHVAFPRGAHDDMVDTSAMALEQIRPDTFTQGPKIF